MPSDRIEIEVTLLANMLDDESQFVNVTGQHEGWRTSLAQGCVTTA